jgi:hypothetical protein
MSGASSDQDNYTLLYLGSNGVPKFSWKSTTYDIDFVFYLDTEYNISFESDGDTVELYIDGVSKFSSEILGDSKIALILGQEQDSYRGNFQSSQCLMGHYSHFCYLERSLNESEREKLISLKEYIGKEPIIEISESKVVKPFEYSEVPIIIPNEELELFDEDSGIPVCQIIKNGFFESRIPFMKSSSGVLFETDDYIYNIKGSVQAVGSWDLESIEIKVGNKKLLYATMIKYDDSDKYLGRNTDTIKTTSVDSFMCDWRDHRSTIIGEKDLLIEFDYNSYENSLFIKSGLNDPSYDELLAINDLVITKTTLKIIKQDNIDNKWNNWLGITDLDIVETDSYQGIVTTGLRTFKKTFSLNKGENYIFRSIISKIHSIDTSDYVKITVNGNILFKKSLNPITITTINPGIVVTKLSNITTDYRKVYADSSRFDSLNQNYTYLFDIDTSFVSIGNDIIEIEFKTDQSLKDEAYGFSDLLILQDQSNIENKVFSSTIAKIDENKSNDWIFVDSKTVKIIIDTTYFDYEDPRYFVSLSSKVSKDINNSLNIVNPTNTSFEIYIKFEDDDVLQFAKDNLTLNWIGVE